MYDPKLIYSISADASHFPVLHNDWLPALLLGQKGSCCLNEKQDNNMAPNFSKKAACLFSR